jgi:isoquinoline 1-oxidoreductase subunit beta
MIVVGFSATETTTGTMDASATRSPSIPLTAARESTTAQGSWGPPIGAVAHGCPHDARNDGDIDRALADAASTIDATYVLPYLAHAPMEPNNAACQMRGDGVLDVWVGTEGPEYVKMNASSIAAIDKEQVEVHVTFAGGSFGLHSSAEHDPVSEAVQIARALDWKHPIKVQSLREEEFKVGRHRAMAVHRVQAGADADGRLTAWHHQIGGRADFREPAVRP